MKGHFLSGKEIERFEKYLREEEKSQNTMEKYIRDVKAFTEYCDGKEIIKETVIAYKQNLIDGVYAVSRAIGEWQPPKSVTEELGWEEEKPVRKVEPKMPGREKNRERYDDGR